MTETALTERPPTVDDVDSSTAGRGDRAWELRLEQRRTELTAHAYRMLGSAPEAEDAVQETFLRAWRSRDGFEGRAPLRSWLYRIATNVCLDIVNGKDRRIEPVPDAGLASGSSDVGVASGPSDPAEAAEIRDTVRLALIAALQHLPPRQRAVLILREVLCWKAGEVAELLHTSVASVNSALQRARWTINAGAVSGPVPPMDQAQRALLGRYVDAFDRYDMDSLLPLLGASAGAERESSDGR
jgi:RNA polymerase sigma-70 factor (ECF subfamily)